MVSLWSVSFEWNAMKNLKTYDVVNVDKFSMFYEIIFGFLWDISCISFLTELAVKYSLYR